jgi:hypothetical protein
MKRYGPIGNAGLVIGIAKAFDNTLLTSMFFLGG